MKRKFPDPDRSPSQEEIELRNKLKEYQQPVDDSGDLASELSQDADR